MDNGIHTAIKLIKIEYRYYYEVCESEIQIISKGFTNEAIGCSPI